MQQEATRQKHEELRRKYQAYKEKNPDATHEVARKALGFSRYQLWIAKNKTGGGKRKYTPRKSNYQKIELPPVTVDSKSIVTAYVFRGSPEHVALAIAGIQ